MGLQIGVEALLQLTDTSDPRVVDAVQGAAANVPGVIGVSEVRQRWMGGRSMVDLAIQVIYCSLAPLSPTLLLDPYSI